MSVRYLEVVTKDVHRTCTVFASQLGVTFSDPVEQYGNARTAPMSDSSGVIGVRAPLRDDEAPTMRTYWLVKDIAASFEAAVDAGATGALPPMEFPDGDQCAIYILDGVEHGLWQESKVKEEL